MEASTGAQAVWSIRIQKRGLDSMPIFSTYQSLIFANKERLSNYYHSFPPSFLVLIVDLTRYRGWISSNKVSLISKRSRIARLLRNSKVDSEIWWMMVQKREPLAWLVMWLVSVCWGKQTFLTAGACVIQCPYSTSRACNWEFRPGARFAVRLGRSIDFVVRLGAQIKASLLGRTAAGDIQIFDWCV